MDDTFLPSEELDKLRREIEFLKRKQGIHEEHPKEDIQDSINSLSKSIHSLMKIFREASDDLKLDTHDAVLVGQKVDKILDRLDKIEVQNEKIAKGIVAIADMIEDLQPGQKKPLPIQKPVFQPEPQQINPQPLPTYGISPEQKKKSFLNMKI